MTMLEFRVWGRIEQTGPDEYAAVASAIREDLHSEGTQVLMKLYPTRAVAEVALREFLLQLGQSIRAKGGRVVDVETDGARLY